MKSRLANAQAKAIAQMVFENFNQHAALFSSTDEHTKRMFQTQNWDGITQSQMARVQTYQDKVKQMATELRQEVGANALSDGIWQQAKTEYLLVLQQHPKSEWAKAYFSSVSTEILKCHYFDNPFTFSKSHSLLEQFKASTNTFSLSCAHPSDLKAVWHHVLSYFDWQTPFAHLETTLSNIMQMMNTHCQTPAAPQIENWQFQVLKHPLYHNQHAYVFGQIVQNDHTQIFALVITHDANALLCIDSILLEPEQIAILFSSMQTYFLADLDLPSTYVEFLHTMSPNQSKDGWYAFLELQK